jgi:hypothetical protein
MSDTQPKAPEQLTVNEQGGWEYPSGSSSGYVEVELPTLPGSLNPTERLHVREFGVHVSDKIERSFNKGYMRTGPQQGPHQVLAHYAAVARGAQLMDDQALKRLESLASEFEKEPLRPEYFEMVIKPYLVSLKPRRR